MSEEEYWRIYGGKTTEGLEDLGEKFSYVQLMQDFCYLNFSSLSTRHSWGKNTSIFKANCNT